jgi:hypothetical protein
MASRSTISGPGWTSSGTRGRGIRLYDRDPIKTNEKRIATPGPKQACFKDPAANILSVIRE